MREDLGASDSSLRSLYLNSLLNRSMCYVVGFFFLSIIVLYVVGKLRAVTSLFARHAPPPPHRLLNGRL